EHLACDRVVGGRFTIARDISQVLSETTPTTCALNAFVREWRMRRETDERRSADHTQGGRDQHWPGAKPLHHERERERNDARRDETRSRDLCKTATDCTPVLIEQTSREHGGL